MRTPTALALRAIASTAVAGCSKTDTPEGAPATGSEVDVAIEHIDLGPARPYPERGKVELLHPEVDFERWSSLFPLRSFVDSDAADGELDLSEVDGSIITGPNELCEIELVRRAYAERTGLGTPVPVDIFVWSVDPPARPFLTKLGGVPHREADEPWPTFGETPATFVGQFCFADSSAIVSKRLPGDVMLVFFKDDTSYWEEDGVQLEWSSLELADPITEADCPKPGFHVPSLSGHIHRTHAFPDAWELFYEAGHGQSFYFAASQSTKIGRETFFIQHDPRWPGGSKERFCALSSVHPRRYPPGAKWPFIGAETMPDDGPWKWMMGDVGCMYFLIDRRGRISIELDCY